MKKTSKQIVTAAEPIQIIANTGKHNTETRVFLRDIHETWCTEPGCKFSGQHAQQGICYSPLDGVEFAYVENSERRAAEVIKELSAYRKKMGDKAYIEHLEAHIFCQWMNSEFALDELVKLRADLGVRNLKKTKKTKK